MITNRCIELVKKYEGFSATPYLCPAGYWTIGYGEVLGKEWKNEWKNLVITKEEAEERLRRKLFQYFLQIFPLVTVPLHPWMWDALTSFSYNVGIFAFRSSSLRQKLNRGEFEDAANEFPRWVYAGGRILKGLKRRREEEKKLFLEGLEELRRWMA